MRLYEMMPQNLSQDQFKKILVRYSKGLSNAQETRFVDQWFESLGKESSVQLKQLDQKEVEDKLWNTISTQIKEKGNIRSARRSISTYRKVTSIAASVLITFVAYFSLNYLLREQTSQRKHEVGGIEIIYNPSASDSVKKIKLEDGSIVALQPGGKLTVKRFRGSHKREVYLEGQAFFEVTPDKNNPFFVYTGNITTRVLGTSFNINASTTAKAIEVSVKTGRVSVTKTSKKSTSPPHTLTEEVILTPNQKAIYSKSGTEVVTALVDNPRRIPIKENHFVMEFEEEPVSSILNAISKAYGVDIVFDEGEIRTCTLTTSLSDEGLYDQLNIICKAIRGSYELNGTQVILHSKGCGN